MKFLQYKLRISEVLFLFAGLGMIASLFFIGDYGFSAWIGPKVAYVLGLLFFIFRK